MDTCELCAEMGNSDNCENCSLGNPCLGCEHDILGNCVGQCAQGYKEENTMATIQNVKLKVVGVTFQNEDTGMSRQKIIESLTTDYKVWLEREPSNKFDINAIKVMSELGQVGYISKDYAAIMAGMMDSGRQFTCEAAEVAKYKDTWYLHVLLNEVV